MKIPKILKNKYFYTGLAFVIWMLFFDSNNMIRQAKLSSNLNRLEKQKAYYLSEIKKDSTALHQLQTDLNTLEKFARERYLMKRDNEDIYLIVREKD